MRADKHEHYSEALREEQKRLRALPPSELRTLPECETLKRKIRSVEVDVTVYRHPHGEDELLIVTQSLRPWTRWWSTTGGSMFVEGFILKADGSITEPAESDLWDYT
jgi:hypothetical protein